MKKKLLITLSIASLLFSQLNAQITANTTDLIPIGRMAFQAYDTMPGASIFPGPAGTNQVWNFSALQHHKYDTINTMDPIGTPYANNFTTANFAFETNYNSNYAFLQNNSTGLYIEGATGSIGDPGNHIIKEYISPHGILMKWPSTYGTNYQDNYTITAKGQFNQFVTYDSIKIKNTIASNCQIDAWGNILTPLGTYPSLRHWRHKIETDSTWAHQISPSAWIFAQAKKDTIDTYTWWTNSPGIGLPLLEIDFDAVADTAAKVKWLYSTPTLGIAEQTDGTSFIAFPNPANNSISIQLNEKEACKISIYDITGKLLDLNQQTTNDITTISTEKLCSGLYFVEVTNKDGKRSAKKISIVH